MINFKKCSDTGDITLYRQHDERFKKVIIFDKRLKLVNIECAFFVLKNDVDKKIWRNITSEWDKYSCKYGFWQSETLVSLSVEEIEFIQKTSKKIFGVTEGELK